MSSKTRLPIVRLNGKYLEEGFKQRLREAFCNKKPFKQDNGIELLTDPFPFVNLPHLLEEGDTDSFLEDLKDELTNLEFFEKNNDLYKFSQSSDLKNVKSVNVSALRTFLYGEFRSWMQDVTKLELSTTIDMSCARYDYTDTLLCHDDMLEGRRIAYIFYLVPAWSKDDGGTLDLFGKDENGDPKTIVRSIVPQWNSFVFFEVSSHSFHQVAEVITEDKTRLSISGWFYGDPIEASPKISRMPPLDMRPAGFIEEECVYEWISSAYLDPNTQMEIRQKFEEDSEVELVRFLNENKYREVAAALKDATIEWKMQGPANKRHFESAENESLPSVLRDCLNLFCSEAMFLILSNITGLTFHELAVESDSSDSENGEPDEKRTRTEKSVNAKCSCEIRRWSHGSYTLIHDNTVDKAEFTLDVILFVDCKDWQSNFGGNTSYLAKDEDEELLTVFPQENALALVFRDCDTLKFVKHINHRSNTLGGNSQFYTITAIYKE